MPVILQGCPMIFRVKSRLFTVFSYHLPLQFYHLPRWPSFFQFLTLFQFHHTFFFIVIFKISWPDLFIFTLWPQGMWNLSSATRDQTCIPWSGSLDSSPLDCQKSLDMSYFCLPYSLGTSWAFNIESSYPRFLQAWLFLTFHVPAPQTGLSWPSSLS